MSDFYKKYKSIKDSFNVFYKGYDMKSVMAQDYLYISYKVIFPKIGRKYIQDCLFYGLDFSSLESSLSENDLVVFNIFNRRKDYMTYLSAIMNSVERSLLLSPIDKSNFRFSLKDILISFVQTFFLNYFRLNLTFRERFFYYLRLVYYKNCLSNLEDQIKEVNSHCYVSFISAEYLSNMLSQFFSKKGITTYCLQHGLHLPVSYYTSNVPLDIFNIDNFTADYFLAWGHCMKKILGEGGIDEKKVLLAGNPNYDVVDFNLSALPLDRVIICLGRRSYVNDNRNLLEIGRQLGTQGVQISIKLHPLDEWENYKSVLESADFIKLPLSMSVKESIDYINPNYVLVLNSTVYYEYYMCNVITFRFGESQDLPIGLDDKFYDYDSFKDTFNRFRQEDRVQLNNRVKAMLDDVFSLGLNRYNEILNS